MQTSILSIFLILFSIPFGINAQSLEANIGSNNQALAGPITYHNAFSVFNNSSLLVYDSEYLIGVYSKNYFQLAGLNQYSFSLSASNKNRGIGIGIQKLGDETFNSSSAKIALSHRISNGSVSLSPILYQDYAQDYGYQHLIGIEFSSSFRPSDNFLISLVIRNPVKYSVSTKSSSNEFLEISSGIRFAFSKDIILHTTFHKSLNRDINLSSGLQYIISEKFGLNLGLEASPLSQHFGIHYRLSKVQFAFSGSYLQQVGFTSSASIYFHFKPKRNEEDR